MNDLYDELGIDSDASQDEIKSGFRKAAQKAHPDKEGGDEEKFHQITRAFDVLSNPLSRREYDATGKTEEVSIDQGAVTMLAAIFAGTIDQLIDLSPDYAKRLDLVSAIKIELQNNIRENAGDIRSEEQKLKKLQTFRKRISAKRGLDIYGGIAAEKISNLRASISRLKRDGMIIERALWMLEYYQDDGHEPEPEDDFNIEPFKKLLREGGFDSGGYRELKNMS